MNILIMSWRGPKHPLAGGAESSTHEHAKFWVRQGHDVTLFTSSVRGIKSKEMLDGIQIIRHGNAVFGVQIWAFFWYLFGGHPKFDIVVDQFHGIPFFTPLYVRTKKLGFIHEVAQPVWEFNSWPRPFNLLPTLIGKYGEPWIFKLLYKNVPFITVSPSTKRDLLHFGIKQVTVVPNGVTLPRVLPKGLKEKIFTVIYVSALTADKGIEDATAAFVQFHEIHHNSQFWIAGKGDKNYVDKLKILWKGHFIKYFGFVGETLKFELLAKAHVLVNTSAHEGWGLVNIEANSVGTPIIGYDVSGTRDSVKTGYSGILVPPEPIYVCGALEKIWNDKKLFSRLSTNSKTWSKKFSWKSSGEASMKLLHNLLTS